MLGSTANIFNVKAKNVLGGGTFGTVWNCNWPTKLSHKVFVLTSTGMERHTPKSWIGPKQQITRIMQNVRFLTVVLIQDPLRGMCHVTCERRIDHLEQLDASISRIYAVHGQ